VLLRPAFWARLPLPFRSASVGNREDAEDLKIERVRPNRIPAEREMSTISLHRKEVIPAYNFFRMSHFQLWAQPPWVNLLILIPLAAAFSFHRVRHLISGRQLIVITLFAGAFGFVEATVVVYLRAATGLLPGYTESLAEVRRSQEIYQPAKSISQIPPSLVTIEVCREVATMIMLTMVVLLAASTRRERWAAFLWAFAFWDLSYYVGLWTTIRWPTSFLDLDVLFLIPVPWIAQVWFPLLVSLLTILIIAWSRGEQPR